MRLFSIKTFRIVSLALIAIVLALSFSCKKDDIKEDTNLNNEEPAQPIVATALITELTDGTTHNLKCYNKKNFGEIMILGDTLLSFKLNTTDKYGDNTDGPYVFISIKSPTGFHQGDVFNLTDSEIIANVVLANNDYFSAIGLNTAVIKINSYTGNQIKGTFEFTAEDAYGERTEVTDGKYEGDVFHN